MYRGDTKSLVFLLMAVSSEKSFRSENNSGCHKVLSLQAFSQTSSNKS